MTQPLQVHAMTADNAISAPCIYALYIWYDLCWKCVHRQVDFSLYEPSLVVEHVKTAVKLTYCDRHVTGTLKSKLPLLGATSNYSNRALYTDPACGIKCLFKV